MKTVVVTGPTGHLGSAMVSHLLDEYNVIGISRSASSLKFHNCLGEYIPMDHDLSEVSSEVLVSLIGDHVERANSLLVGLVNNAFTAYPASAMSVDVSAVQASAESFVGIHVRLSLALSNLFKASHGGSIINVSSMYGRVSPRHPLYSSPSAVNPLLYGVFKAGLIQASRYLSSLLASDNVRVNSVSYGPFPSQDVQNTDPEFIERLADQTHLRRIGFPHEAAGVISFLLSDHSSYVTGADIPVDGGWTAW